MKQNKSALRDCSFFFSRGVGGGAGGMLVGFYGGSCQIGGQLENLKKATQKLSQACTLMQKFCQNA